MAYPKGMVIPAYFRGYYPTEYDFSQVKNISFVILEMAKDFETPNPTFHIGVERCAQAGLPCFAMLPVSAQEFYAAMAHGDLGPLNLWKSMIEHKDLRGAFLKLYDTAKDGHDLPPVNLAQVIEVLLRDFRNAAVDIPPKMLNRNNIMLMTDGDTIEKYTHTQYVPTQLSRELLLSPCDVYRNINHIFRSKNDWAFLDIVYDSLDLIGLDGEPHNKQDSLYSQAPFMHYWATDYIQTPAIELSNGGEGVVGAAVYYGTLEELEEWTGMEINVNTDDPIDPPIDPPDPPIDDTLKEAVKTELTNLSDAIGGIIGELEANDD